MLIDEGDISNYLGVTIKERSDGTFKWSQLYLVDKIINHVGLTMFASLKERETPSWKPLLHKDKSSIGRECVWNYREVVGMLSYIQGLTRAEISMAVHQCAHFWNNPRLVHKQFVRCIAKCPASTYIYVDLLDRNWRLTTCCLVYSPNI